MDFIMIMFIVFTFATDGKKKGGRKVKRKAVEHNEGSYQLQQCMNII